MGKIGMYVDESGNFGVYTVSVARKERQVRDAV